ncbi:hypothetical protein ACJROZ_13565 [Acetobacter indonesiensis]
MMPSHTLPRWGGAFNGIGPWLIFWPVIREPSHGALKAFYSDAAASLHAKNNPAIPKDSP